MKIGTDCVLLGVWANIVQASSILDIGSGSGILALMCAQRNKIAAIHAIEIDREACIQARENTENSKWSDRIKNIHISLQDYCKNNIKKKYDSIISNPPYFDKKSNTDILNPERSKARSSETLSFDDLQESVLSLLKDSGNFSLILPLNEGHDFIRTSLDKGFFLKRLTEVIPREGKAVNRLLIELVPRPSKTVKGELTIRNSGKGQHDYTCEFAEMHKKFYIFLEKKHH